MALSQARLQDTNFLDTASKQEIIDALWPKDNAKTSSFIWDAYFSSYERQCNHALHDQGKHIVVRKHQHIVNVVRQLEALSTRDQIKPSLSPLFTTPKRENEDEILDNSINLAARLYLMVNVGASKYAISGQSQPVWSHGNLKDFLNIHFKDKPRFGHGNIKLERIFKGCNLEKIGGIKIEWTDNLADHLRMIDDDDKIVAVFHHASFLKRQNSQLFPPGLVEETLRTIALLFPQHDSETERWYEKLNGNPHVIDTMLLRCGSLRLDDRQIEKFTFWHDRLMVLKQAFDESRPTTLSQWWHDRRNSVQWYTFWVAIVVLALTIFFGFVQSIEGALQVYKAYHPTST